MWQQHVVYQLSFCNGRMAENSILVLDSVCHMVLLRPRLPVVRLQVWEKAQPTYKALPVTDKLRLVAYN